MRRGLLVALGVLGACNASGVVDLDDTPADPLRADGAKLVVLVFVATECPISNRYAPELARLASTYGPRGVRLTLVYADPALERAEVRRHLLEYALPRSAVRDPKLSLVERTGARVTPEAVVYTAEGALVYRGRIDDQFPALGRARPQATTHDLEDAIERALAGDVRTATTTAVGCYIR